MYQEIVHQESNGPTRFTILEERVHFSYVYIPCKSLMYSFKFNKINRFVNDRQIGPPYICEVYQILARALLQD